MSEEHERLEQRAFSPEEVATMLGVARTTVSSLLAGDKLGSKKIGDVQRIFLSDLEDYLGEERARSLVRDINSGIEDTGSSTFQNSTSESSASDRDDSTDLDVDFDMAFDTEGRNRDDRTLGADAGRGRGNRYEPVVRKWNEIDQDNEAIVLADLSKNDIQNIRNLLYRRVGKENVIVRAVEQWDGTFKAVIRARGGNKYLRE